MYLISLIVVGLIVGALARLLHPGKDDISWPMTIVLGAVSMLIGGLVLEPIIGVGGGFIGAVVIAVILLVLYARHAGGTHRARD